MLEKGNKKLIRRWAFYDWANSVYSLVISTAIFPIYYESVTQTESGTIRFMGFDLNPTSLYTYSLSFSFLIVALISPFLSGIADYVGNKKAFLKGFCYTGALSVMSLYFFTGLDTLWVGILFSVLASIGFWGSIVFYNAYLPEIAYNDQQDNASALGFMYGYMGSVLLLIFNLTMVMKPSWYGIVDESMPPRIAFLTVGIWWVGFAQVTFRSLKDPKKKNRTEGDYLFKGYQELRKVVAELKDQPVLLNFLTAFFLYSVGVQSIILLATLYAKTEIGLPTSSLILTIIVIQVVGIAGAYFFSRLSKVIGNINAIRITILIWAACSLSAYYLNREDPNVQIKFYMISGGIGLVLGAIQTLSRSTYSKLLPENTTDPTTYFSFFDVTEKMAIVWGTFIFGLAVAITETMRLSILLLCLFFVVSLVVLSFMKKTKYVR